MGSNTYAKNRATNQRLGFFEPIFLTGDEDTKFHSFLLTKEDKQMSWRSDEKKLTYVLNQFIRSYQMGAIEGTAEDLDGIWNALNEGYEHEGSMARNQLGRTAELASMIQSMISDDTNLEEWVESKITKAQDYLSSVLNYMRGESLSEREMTDKEKEKRSDIAKDISTKDLQKRYGVDREEAEDIKYAIATKSAMGKKK